MRAPNLSFLTTGLTLLLSTVTLSGIAFADPMLEVKGITSGTFSSGTPSLLTFAGTPFDVVTAADGSASVTLGSFHLDNPDASGQTDFAGDSFTLSVTFLLPAGIDSPGQSHPFTAGLTGSINRGNDADSVVVDFPDTPLLFTFNDGVHSGSFTLLVNDLAVPKEIAGTGHPNDGNATLTGAIGDPVLPASAVPEPTSLVLLGTAGLGLGWIFRRRRS
jgi:hypothetical protein